jgi:hypothetical protein
VIQKVVEIEVEVVQEETETPTEEIIEIQPEEVIETEIVEVIEDEIDYNSYTVAKLKEMIIELGAEPVDGLKADLIEQIKGLV